MSESENVKKALRKTAIGISILIGLIMLVPMPHGGTPLGLELLQGAWYEFKKEFSAEGRARRKNEQLELVERDRKQQQLVDNIFGKK